MKDSSYELSQINIQTEVAMKNLAHAEAAMEWPHFQPLTQNELKTVVAYAKWRVEHAMRAVDRISQNSSRALKDLREENQPEDLPF